MRPPVLTSLILALCSLAVIGCGKSAPSPADQNLGEHAGETTVAGNPVTASTHDVGEAAATESVPAQQALDSKTPKTDQAKKNEGLIATSSSADASPSQVQTVAPETAMQSSQTPQVSEPSAEQLAKWDLAKFDVMQLLECREPPQTELVTRMVLMPDGRYALGGNRLTVWTISDGKQEHELLNQTNEQFIQCLTVSPDGKTLAAGDNQGVLKLWNVPDFKPIASNKIYPSGVTHAAFTPDSRTLVTTSYDGEVTSWQVNPWQKEHTIQVSDQAIKQLVVIAPDQLLVAAEKITLWSLADKRRMHTLSDGGYNATIALSPDHKYLAYTDNEKLHFWDVGASKKSFTFPAAFASHELASFSSAGDLLATANGSAIRIWDAEDGRLHQFIDSFGSEVVGLEWLSDTQLLLISTANGLVRIWGNTSAGDSIGLKPIHAEVAKVPANAKSPAFTSQDTAMIDLRSFSRPPQSITQMDNATFISYITPFSPEEVLAFYRYTLGKEAWTTSTEDLQASTSATFEKEQYKVSVSCYIDGEKQTNVGVNLSGNFDLRWLPKDNSPETKVIYENHETVQYRTKTALPQLEAFILSRFSKLGWTAYSRLHASQINEPNSRTLPFVQNGTTLMVSISRPPDAPDQFHVAYSKSLTMKSLPIPKDSSFVEYEDSTKPMLVASTSLNLKETCQFYDAQMLAQGWLPLQKNRRIREDLARLSYYRGQQDVTIGFIKLPDGHTRILAGEGLQNSSWQLAKAAEPSKESVTQGLEAADFPLLIGAQVKKYSKETEQVEFEVTGTTTVAVAEAYSKELSKLGWTAQDSGIMDDDYALKTFEKESLELTLRVTKRADHVAASLSGNGIVWTKPLPGPKQVVSYETWIRTNRYPATLDLLDRYIQEMDAIANAKQ